MFSQIRGHSWYWQSSCSLLDVVQNLPVDFGANISWLIVFGSYRNDKLADSTAGTSSTFLSSFRVPKRVCKSFASRCVFCNVAFTFVFLLCNKIVN